MRGFPVILMAFAMTALYTIHDRLPPLFMPVAAVARVPAKLTTWVAQLLGYSGEVYDSLPVIFGVNLVACGALALLFAAFAGRKR